MMKRTELFQIPLMVAAKYRDGYRIERYIGVAFFLDDKGLAATCRHIVDSIDGSNQVIVAKDLGSGAIGIVELIAKHHEFDFAVIRFNQHSAPSPLVMATPDPGLGDDVRALGFVESEKNENGPVVIARLMRGYVVSAERAPFCEGGRKSYEVSFPSVKGFSGAPLIEECSGNLAGMMFMNSESYVTVHEHTEIDDDGACFVESRSRVIEFGVSHSLEDLRCFLKDLGISL